MWISIFCTIFAVCLKEGFGGLNDHRDLQRETGWDGWGLCHGLNPGESASGCSMGLAIVMEH